MSGFNKESKGREYTLVAEVGAFVSCAASNAIIFVPPSASAQSEASSVKREFVQLDVRYGISSSVLLAAVGCTKN